MRPSPVAVALAVRLIMLCFGWYHDKYGLVKYTDIDYVVATDAARRVCDGDSPYTVQGYRYPPLLAVLLTPTCHFYDAGKILFVLADLLVVFLIQLLIGNNPGNSKWVWFWALNPMAAVIPTRGSFDPISNMLVLLSLYFCTKRSSVLCGTSFGVVVYLRVYPIIYAPAFCFFLMGDGVSLREIPRVSELADAFRFILATSASAGFLVLLSFFAYGQEYIESAITYHFSRLDYRHNFSVHFLWVYSLYGHDNLLAQRVLLYISTIPQVSLVFLSSVILAKRNIVGCLLVATLIFVSFNKVSTAQYFTWYAIFIPIVFGSGSVRMDWWMGIYVLWWVLSLSLWLYFAYTLEFEGMNRFIHVWMSSLLFQAANVHIVLRIITQLKNVEAAGYIPVKQEESNVTLNNPLKREQKKLL